MIKGGTNDEVQSSEVRNVNDFLLENTNVDICLQVNMMRDQGKKDRITNSMKKLIKKMN